VAKLEGNKSYLSITPCAERENEKGEEGTGEGPPMKEELLESGREDSSRGLGDNQSSVTQADLPIAVCSVLRRPNSRAVGDVWEERKTPEEGRREGEEWRASQPGQVWDIDEQKSAMEACDEPADKLHEARVDDSAGVSVITISVEESRSLASVGWGVTSL